MAGSRRSSFAIASPIDVETIDLRRFDELAAACPTSLDLTRSEHLDAVEAAAEELVAAYPRADLLAAVDLELTGRERSGERGGEGSPLALGARVALKLAMSRRVLGDIERPHHVSIVFAVFREHVRILPASEHPDGEDFVRRKLDQLRWLFGPTPRHSWDLTIVDDGCSEDSGRLARAVLNESLLPGEEARVMFLEDAIRDRLPVARGMSSTNDSRKGGSIRFGLWNAAREQRGSDHLVLFTDADLSTHLGQTGLLVHPFDAADVTAAIGSRREPTSVVVKTGTRNVRGKLFIYLWKRLLPQLRGVFDTQCGFKAFRADRIESWIEDTVENGFAFDIELLLHTHLERPGSIVKVPVAWIDSEALSTTTDLEPYLPMLRRVVDFYRRYLPVDGRAEEFAGLIEALDAESFQRLVDAVPAAIASREPLEFDEFDEVTASDLRGIAFRD